MSGRGNPYHDPKTGQFTNALSGQMYNVGSGMNSSRPEDRVKHFPTENELIEYGKEQQVEQFNEERERLNQEEKRRDELKKQRKPARKAMKKQYNIGEKISLDNKAYTVVVVHNLGDKLAGYRVQASDGQYKYITKYGELRDDYPKRRDEL